MHSLHFLQCVALFFTHFLTINARVNVVAYKNENLNSCDITIDLSDTGLRRLSVNFTNAQCVRSLNLQNNEIEDFKEKIFNQYPYMEYLDLSRNRLPLNKFFSYGGESSLKVFMLDHNGYYNSYTDKQSSENAGSASEVIDEKTSYLENNKLYVSDIYTDLEYLSLRNVSLQHVSNNFWHYLPKLKQLDLSENKLSLASVNFLLRNTSSSVKRLVLENIELDHVITENLNTVEELNLNHNRFVRLTSTMCYPDTFCLENMQYLKSLFISNCSVKAIDENAFRFMTSLLELDISNNLFKRIANGTFDYLPTLTSLNLSSNTLYNMPNFEGLRNLTTLLLNGMKSKKLLQYLESFAHMPKLQYLSMRDNKLTKISATLFNNLPSLEKIDLSNNLITSLPSWDTQKALRQLHLSYNKIQNLDDLSIKEARSLELLVLKHNLISRVKVDSIKKLPNDNIILDL
ncbi:protein artichoke-like [Nasonia vitripennis]|uniref:Uncharacterized protein n=1 Tax=Nasonia vitripennis TaxID=7425 RepID=A0A7M7M258_NASVI|nr:protein artichoke-like [Nasonia vitripennis]